MPIEDTLCPNCTKKMVRRTGAHGPFWGCPDYPKCKGTRDTMGRSTSEREADTKAERRRRSYGEELDD